MAERKDADKNKGQAPRTGRLARGAVAGAAVARMGAARLAHQVGGLARPAAEQAAARAEHEQRLGRILFGALNQLKGTALKAAQLLSLEMGLLPEGLRRQLAQAHHQATPLNRALVLKLMKQEFGRGPEALFAQFQPQAFAAASLGQVHEARSFAGERLAVKLQYPGMAAAVDSDLRLLAGLLRPLGAGLNLALPDEALTRGVLEQLRARLLEELDYEREARELAWFGARMQALPDLVLPRVHTALSSARVLSMDHLDGLHLEPWLATAPSQAQRDRMGQLLLDSFMLGLTRLRRIQADPHPGNYLFMPDGRLGLLDFGRTLALDGEFLPQLARAWAARLDGDTAGHLAAYQRLGMVDPELGPRAFRERLMPALAPLLDWQLLPWRGEHFDFASLPPPPTMAPDAHRVALAHLRAVPPELPFVDRAYLGLVQMLRQLGARVRTGNPWAALAREIL
ncbi:AarF/ABC1/UbiB kinase family protein [Pelomonas sp. CA6]|uniref:ABC1 kinase family protein n=1 Tax=Pelomonas sp. CA6 TaxID=2907999 RepID=UPI001F4BFD91|nr:AarF/ABC1/UbiB kinase family protein [Pelomonas sp. CA6]MCH7345454.1 AarF/ABC1/UbiB kinase family protein [Pelomonas sp. CA6]